VHGCGAVSYRRPFFQKSHFGGPRCNHIFKNVGPPRVLGVSFSARSFSTRVHRQEKPESAPALDHLRVGDVRRNFSAQAHALVLSCQTGYRTSLPLWQVCLTIVLVKKFIRLSLSLLRTCTMKGLMRNLFLLALCSGVAASAEVGEVVVAGQDAEVRRTRTQQILCTVFVIVKLRERSNEFCLWILFALFLMLFGHLDYFMTMLNVGYYSNLIVRSSNRHQSSRTAARR